MKKLNKRSLLLRNKQSLLLRNKQSLLLRNKNPNILAVQLSSLGSFGSKVQESKPCKNEGAKNIKQHQNYIWITHALSFPTNIIAKLQKSKLSIPPNITTNQFILSTPSRNGETTVLAKNTWPISALISESTLNWESESLGVCTKKRSDNESMVCWSI